MRSLSSFGLPHPARSVSFQERAFPWTAAAVESWLDASRRRKVVKEVIVIDLLVIGLISICMVVVVDM